MSRNRNAMDMSSKRVKWVYGYMYATVRSCCLKLLEKKH